jgi:tripartite-type tricarboxylate transporter receptor subunit TctC
MEHLQLTYNGGQAALNALAASEIDLMFAALPLVLPYIEAGRMPAIALASPQRFPLLPNLPTAAEQGAAEITWEGWFGVYASRRMATGARDQLLASLTRSLATRAVRAGLLQQGLQPTQPDSETFAPRLLADRDRAAAVLSAAP